MVWFDTYRSERKMRLRCPHCHHPVEVLDESSFSGIVCSTCGSNFSLVGGTDETETSRAGSRSIGHFTLAERLGIGAFGTVWKDESYVLVVAVAEKRPFGNPDANQRLREGRLGALMAQLQHSLRGVTRIAVWRAEGTEDGLQTTLFTLFIVKEAAM